MPRIEAPVLPSQWRRLNLLQQAMALWEEAHPYNAGCVVRLCGRANLRSLQEAVETASRMAGVGKLVLDKRKRRYRYEPVDTIELSEIDRGDSPLRSLWAKVTEQINARFPDEPRHPLRWYVLDDPESNSHFLVGIWRHVVADAASIHLLFRRVLNQYFCPSPDDDQPIQVLSPQDTRVMKRRYGQLGYLKTLFRAVRLYFELRRVYRMPESKGEGDALQFRVSEAPAGLLDRLTLACKLRQATVNDAFLAALFATIADMTPNRRTHQRRRGLAIGSAVDLRGSASQDLSICFGLYLSHWITIVEEPDMADSEQLLARIVRQTRREKAEKRFLGPQWNFLALALLRRLSLMTNARAWYRKVYPVSGGISNVKLSASWFAGAGERILDYILVSPTGPVLPFVLAAATLNDKLNLTLVYRRSSLTCLEARKLIDLFLAKLELFSRSSRA